MRPIILIIFSSIYFHSYTQELSGVIVDRSGDPIAFANVELQPAGFMTTTDTDGRFIFKELGNRTHRLQVSAPSYKTIVETIDLADTKNVYLKITLNPAVETLQEVVVKAESAVQIVSREPLSITSINAKTVQAINTDPVDMLNRTSGVRVRQSGGLGSEVNISIQGTQEDAVRRYYDGLPIKFLPRGLDVNNMPINQVERIDIYRGVTPLEVGTDALGGGINIIPKKPGKTYVDVSYQYGSFNTHRPSVNLFFLNKSDIFFGSNVFYNYSDNDYKIDAHDLNEEARRAENIIEVRRFHNRYEATYGDFYFGLKNKKWADEFKVTAMYNDVHTEIQTPVIFSPVKPFGEVTGGEHGFNLLMDYKLSSADDRLSVKVKAGYGEYTQEVNDSTRFFYNWFGERLNTPNSNGAELSNNPLDLALDREVLLGRFTSSYKIGSHKLTISNLLIRQDRKGRNELIVDAGNDPLAFPSFLSQNYAGLEWKASWLQEKLETVTTYKNYQLNAEATSLEDLFPDENDDGFEARSASNNYHGANAAIKYSFNSNFFIRSSFEYAYRLPEEEELFGNLVTIRSNINLRPEQSDNINLGLFYRTYLFGNMPIAVELNGFYRYQRDRIVLLASGIDLAQFFNEEEVEISGADAFISFEPFKNARSNFAVTYQDLRIRSVLDFTETDLIGERLFNVPPFFLTFDASYELPSLFLESDALTLTYFYDFVDEFPAIRVTNFDQDQVNFVPTQNIHSLEVTYIPPGKSWSISGRTNNIFNDDVFDNFRVQRPGRNFNIKVRYVFE